MALKAPPLRAAEVAIGSIGIGYDLTADIRLKFCDRSSPPEEDPCLIELDRSELHEIVLPGGLSVPNVPKSIKCDKGERMRFRSDVLSFQQMSEQFNQEISLSGKIPCGLFNHMFDFSGCWQKDAASTKTLAFDGWFITLYTVALSKAQIVLRDHVKQAVPSTWDPAALARFIEKFGTHIIVGVKMGGKDVIYVRQQHSSTLLPVKVQETLKELADRRFLDVNGQYDINYKDPYGKDKFDFREQKLRFVASNSSSSYTSKEDLMIIFKRRGGKDSNDISHNEWLSTVPSEPDLPRQWAPVYGDLPLGPHQRRQSSAALQISFMGPKLYVNTSLVDVGKRPVTGLRLYLEGKRSNRLAIHLQHLSSLPQMFQLQDHPNSQNPNEPFDRKYFEPIQWKHFSHVCTGPVESDDNLAIVTGAQLHVAHHGFKKVLFLRLFFSTVLNAASAKSPEWDGSPNLFQKSGLISTLISTHFSMAAQKPPPRPTDVNINSAVYPGGPPAPVQAPKLLRFIDTTEMARGPQDLPGYWVVSGAKLHLERGKISLRVRYSLLTAILPDDDYSSVEDT
ncbi:MACPF domain-containing protein [Ananas comosus]|uniref:MACPF domain-containing protein n=1 Tax=Ananas comosus TaxID=4615 RepID=A0A199UGB1_ANACO|nr:MACPF domain-containing protein [Ananas comosus]